MKQLNNALRTLAFLAALQLAASEASAYTYLRSAPVSSAPAPAPSLSVGTAPTVEFDIIPEGDREEWYHSKYGVKSARTGDTTVGAGVSFVTQMQKGSRNDSIRDCARARANSSAYIYLFGRRFNLVNLQLHANRDHYKDCVGGMDIRSNKLYLNYLGWAIMNENSASYASKDKNWNYTLFSYTQRFMLGPVPFSVKVKAGVGFGMDLTSKQTTAGVKLAGKAGAWAFGSVSFAVDVVVAEAGVRATLKFFQTFLTVAMKPQLKFLDGSVSLVSLAITLKIELYVKVGYSYASHEETKTIASWSTAAVIKKLMDL